jgi:hypothetical protein
MNKRKSTRDPSHTECDIIRVMEAKLNDYDSFRIALHDAKHIIVLAGAGLSAASGASPPSPTALFRSLIVFQESQLSAEQEDFGEHM